MKKYTNFLVLIAVLVVLVLWFGKKKPTYSSANDERYNRIIDSLQQEINKSHATIATLDSVKNALDSQIAEDKKELRKAANKAAEYKDKYEKEHSRIDDMSDDGIILEFTTIFK